MNNNRNTSRGASLSISGSKRALPRRLSSGDDAEACIIVQPSMISASPRVGGKNFLACTNIIAILIKCLVCGARGNNKSPLS